MAGSGMNKGSASGGLKAALKRRRGLVALKRLVWNALGIDSKNGATLLDLIETFPAFQPVSAGSYNDRVGLAINTVNATLPALRDLAMTTSGAAPTVTELASLPLDPAQARAAELLKVLYDRHHSDKASSHNYYLMYGYVLHDPASVSQVFEIGLGTNNTDVVSNMGVAGRPGASLRAFRDFLPNATIHGADVDRRVLFEEERIHTHFVDQTDDRTFADLGARLQGDFDLMIDDGLHSPDANLLSLKFFLPRLKVGGWAIIEDVGIRTLPLWQTVAILLPATYRTTILQTRAALMIAVQRIG